MGFFDIIMLALAVYVLYAAITGKGKLYDTSNVKEGLEKKYMKTMRLFYTALGVEMIINSGSSIVLSKFFTTVTEEGYSQIVNEPTVDVAILKALGGKFFTILGYVMFGLLIVTVIVMVMQMRKFIDKEKQQQQQTASRQGDPRQAGHTLPVDAFDFSEDGDFVDRDEDPMSPEEKAFKEELAAIRDEEE